MRRRARSARAGRRWRSPSGTPSEDRRPAVRAHHEQALARRASAFSSISSSTGTLSLNRNTLRPRLSALSASAVAYVPGVEMSARLARRQLAPAPRRGSVRRRRWPHRPRTVLVGAGPARRAAGPLEGRLGRGVGRSWRRRRRGRSGPPAAAASASRPAAARTSRLAGVAMTRPARIDPGERLELGGDLHQLDRIAIAVAEDASLDGHAQATRRRGTEPCQRLHRAPARRRAGVRVPEVAPQPDRSGDGSHAGAGIVDEHRTHEVVERSANSPAAAWRSIAALTAVVRRVDVAQRGPSEPCQRMRQCVQGRLDADQEVVAGRGQPWPRPTSARGPGGGRCGRRPERSATSVASDRLATARSGDRRAHQARPGAASSAVTTGRSGRPRRRARPGIGGRPAGGAQEVDPQARLGNVHVLAGTTTGMPTSTARSRKSPVVDEIPSGSPPTTRSATASRPPGDTMLSAERWTRHDPGGRARQETREPRRQGLGAARGLEQAERWARVHHQPS